LKELIFSKLECTDSTGLEVCLISWRSCWL